MKTVGNIAHGKIQGLKELSKLIIIYISIFYVKNGLMFLFILDFFNNDIFLVFFFAPLGINFLI
jgi:hypothetical protein